jgi:amidase
MTSMVSSGAALTLPGLATANSSEPVNNHRSSVKTPKPSDEFLDYDALGLAELIKSKQVTPAELTEVVIRRIEALNPTINCIATQTFERARTNAKTILPSTTFAGVPSLVKDMIDVAGIRRTDGSRLLATNIPKNQLNTSRPLKHLA